MFIKTKMYILMRIPLFIIIKFALISLFTQTAQVDV